MTWSELSQGDVSHYASVVDSARFDRPVSRLTVPLTSEIDAGSIAAMVADSSDDVVIVRYPANRVDWFVRLAATGWSVIAADVLGYWTMAVGDGRRRPSTLTSPAPGDHDLRAFIRKVFAGYRSHYLANPLFDPAAVAEGYAEWVENSARGDGLITLGTPAGRLVALATAVTVDDITECTISGVDPEFQGHGAMFEVSGAVEDLAAARGSTRILRSTVAHNVNAQKAFVRYGFEPLASFLTLHAVRPGLLPDQSMTSRTT